MPKLHPPKPDDQRVNSMIPKENEIKKYISFPPVLDKSGYPLEGSIGECDGRWYMIVGGEKIFFHRDPWVWYGVTEDLPPPGVPVLVWDNQEVVTAVREEGEYSEHWVLCDSRLHEEFGVTAAVVCWMLIPEIPERFK